MNEGAGIVLCKEDGGRCEWMGVKLSLNSGELSVCITNFPARQRPHAAPPRGDSASARALSRGLPFERGEPDQRLSRQTTTYMRYFLYVFAV